MLGFVWDLKKISFDEIEFVIIEIMDYLKGTNNIWSILLSS